MISISQQIQEIPRSSNLLKSLFQVLSVRDPRDTSEEPVTEFRTWPTYTSIKSQSATSEQTDFSGVTRGDVVNVQFTQVGKLREKMFVEFYETHERALNSLKTPLKHIETVYSRI